MRPPQFSVRTLLWLTLVVAAFFAGTSGGNRRAKEVIQWERQIFRQKKLQDRNTLAEKEKTIKELKERLQAPESQSQKNSTPY